MLSATLAAATLYRLGESSKHFPNKKTSRITLEATGSSSFSLLGTSYGPAAATILNSEDFGKDPMNSESQMMVSK